MTIVVVAAVVPMTARAMNRAEENSEREQCDTDGLLEAEDCCEEREPDR